MSLTFSHLCSQIAAASIASSPYDVPTKPLSALLNEMTYYVAVQAKSTSEDEAIIFG